MQRIRHWWRQPDSYHWLSGYLAYRNVRGFTRKMMGAIVVVLGAVPGLMLLSPSGPSGFLSRAVSVLVVAFCAVLAIVWFTRWPSREQSVAFSIIANLCIAASCLVWPNPLIGLLGCIAFAALAGYVAFFHSGHLLLMVLATAAVTSSVRTLEIARSGDVFLAIVALLLIGIGVLAVPFSAQVLVHLLGDDALQSHTDSLTGLRNRRGFYRAVRELLRPAAGPRPPYLMVAMIDLDRFKNVNDTRGHATGDRILVAVAASLRRATHKHAVIARVGGEEFLVAEVVRYDDADTMAERLRAAVAQTDGGITASVGVACHVLDTDPDDTRALLTELVEAADTAMYQAKRSGGNQFRRA